MSKGDFGYGSTVEATFQKHGGIGMYTFFMINSFTKSVCLLCTITKLR